RRERVAAPLAEPLPGVVGLAGPGARCPVGDALGEGGGQELCLRRDQRGVEELRVAGCLLETLADRDRADVETKEHAGVAEERDIVRGVAELVVPVRRKRLADGAVGQREPGDAGADPAEDQRALGRESERRGQQVERVATEDTQGLLPGRRKLLRGVPRRALLRLGGRRLLRARSEWREREGEGGGGGGAGFHGQPFPHFYSRPQLKTCTV